jgi:hypothetical protein
MNATAVLSEMKYVTNIKWRKIIVFPYLRPCGWDGLAKFIYWFPAPNWVGCILIFYQFCADPGVKTEWFEIIVFYYNKLQSKDKHQFIIQNLMQCNRYNAIDCDKKSYIKMLSKTLIDVKETIYTYIKKSHNQGECINYN